MVTAKQLRYLSWAAMIGSLGVLYLGAYFAFLSPLPIRAENADPQPFYDCHLIEYGEHQAPARIVFAPAHALDRLLRPAKWERREP